MCDRCLAIGAVSGCKNVCVSGCKGGRAMAWKIKDAERGA